jgi:hypothetical protein
MAAAPRHRDDMVNRRIKRVEVMAVAVNRVAAKVTAPAVALVNVERVDALVGDAVPLGADLVVAPESYLLKPPRTLRPASLVAAAGGQKLRAADDAIARRLWFRSRAIDIRVRPALPLAWVGAILWPGRFDTAASTRPD